MTSCPHTDDPKNSWPKVGERTFFGSDFVEVYAHAKLPTAFGEFELFTFRNSIDTFEHVALVHGNVANKAEVPVRLHSECLTGDVFGSLRCDCREQLTHALTSLGKADYGMLLYMRQEGRGIGLGNKVRAYALQQQQGLDTVDANRHLGFDDDLRDYRVAAWILQIFAPKSVQILTNNPRKIFGLTSHGVNISGREPLVIDPNPHNVDYLRTKAEKSGHLLPFKRS